MVLVRSKMLSTFRENARDAREKRRFRTPKYSIFDSKKFIKSDFEVKTDETWQKGPLYLKSQLVSLR